MPASTEPRSGSLGSPGSPGPPGSPAASGTPSRRVEYALRAGGVIVAVALALTSAFWESVLTSSYVMSGGHQIRLPVAPILAVACNVALIWFVERVTGKVAYAVLPGIAWFAVIFLAASLTAEGDLIILGNWVGTLTLLLGTLSWAAGAYVSVIRGRRRSLPAAPVPAQKQAGAGRPPANLGPKPGQTASPGTSAKSAGAKPPGAKSAGAKPPGTASPGAGSPSTGSPSAGSPSGRPAGPKRTGGAGRPRGRR